MSGLRFHCVRSPMFDDSVQVYITRRTNMDAELPKDRKKEHAVLTWEPLSESLDLTLYANTGPALNLDADEARGFMDQLWHMGIRPTNVAIEIGALPATRAHLDDMRRLAFERVGLPPQEPKKEAPELKPFATWRGT